MTNPENPRRVEVRDDDQTVAAAEVAVSGDAGGTARASLHAESGHVPPGKRTDLVDAVMDLPEVQASARLQAAVPIGDSEFLERLRQRTEEAATRPAGSTALVDAAIGLIAERGVRGFSLAEASRRLGVTTAAPYRHFADRDELLAAVAVRALSVFTAMLGSAADAADTPAQRLTAMAGAYVRFAAEQRPLFDVVYATGLDKTRYPELRAAYERVDEPLDSCVAQLCPNDPEAAEELADALEASAHGHAMLLLDGSYGEGAAAVERAEARAARVTLALILGRAALRRPSAGDRAGDDLTG